MLNLFIVWALTGLWHGAAWNFLIWGLYGFLLLLIDKRFEKIWSRVPTPLLWLGTFLLTVTGWVLFYHTDLAAAGAHLGALLGIGVNGWIDAAALTTLKRYALFLPITLGVGLMQ